MNLRTATALAALLALAGLAAGCGDGKADAAGTTGQTYTLRIGSIGTNNNLSGPTGYWNRKGQLVPALRRVGVTAVKVVTFPNGPDLNQALVAGELDLATYGDTPALVARGANQPTRLIAQAQVNLDAGIVASKKPGAPATLKDLAGKKVAVQTGSYIHRYLLGALNQEGIKPAQVIHLYATDTEAALERGDIDAAAVPIANYELLKRKGYPSIDLASTDHPAYRGTSATIVTEKFLSAHKDFVAAWQQFQRDATADAKAHWDDYLAYATSINGFPADVVKATTFADQLPDQPFTDNGLKLLEGTRTFLVEQKFIKKEFTLDDWIAPGART
jgi:NitT/TauT family transport system substrate-binding protein/sulfonate transport system substrate-binding protein